jgi:hypothetical protein
MPATYVGMYSADTVLRYFVDLHIADRQNFNFQIADITN